MHVYYGKRPCSGRVSGYLFIYLIFYFTLLFFINFVYFLREELNPEKISAYSSIYEAEVIS